MTKKEGVLLLSLFILMVILTGAPLLLPEQQERVLIESGLFIPLMFTIEFLVVFPLYFFLLRKKEGFGMGAFSLKDFILFFTLILIIQFAIPALAAEDPEDVSNYEFTQPLISFIFIQISYIILAPVYEEIAIRGGLFGSLNIFLRAKVPAAILSSLIFSFLHTQYSGYKPFVILFFVSLTLTVARIRSNGLLLPVMLHILMNCIVINKHYFFS
ncbi:CPBP family intramembrane glutamic endopeptidase [Erwinia persicina]|uniref:CPBP family intramembrane glutamic endopeptidase n=1 Tax=Erwinia persicina TaxID=55211 RepID=UPI00078864E2|nr:type II CAAX endopeptidase family protein [Erwinia persicina]MBD8169628.1 CPBP family intramembrane metalloprotease [Erwinia persicina]MCQ4105860.1 CPBP family intramembrane metalloprotease [Erwinia persicina]UTX15194.1 CPBP family intramembrane metalloprotease [Erwinia persicina]